MAGTRIVGADAHIGPTFRCRPDNEKRADEGIRLYKGKNRREQRNAHPQFVGAALAAARREPPYHEECEADT